MFYLNDKKMVGSGDLPVGEWVHVSLVLNGPNPGSELSVYVDGDKRDSLVEDFVGGMPEGPGNGALMVTPDGGNQPNLIMDELTFWNRILSPEEITKLYQSYQSGNK